MLSSPMSSEWDHSPCARVRPRGAPIAGFPDDTRAPAPRTVCGQGVVGARISCQCWLPMPHLGVEARDTDADAVPLDRGLDAFPEHLDGLNLPGVGGRMVCTVPQLRDGGASKACVVERVRLALTTPNLFLDAKSGDLHDLSGQRGARSHARRNQLILSPISFRACPSPGPRAGTRAAQCPSAPSPVRACDSASRQQTPQTPHLPLDGEAVVHRVNQVLARALSALVTTES